MKWTEILLSGLVTALIVFILNELLDRWKKRQQIKSYALLLFFEVNDQLYWLENLNSLSIKMFVNTPDTEWDNCRHFLAEHISYEKFSILIKHYRSVRAARKVLAAALNPSALPDEFKNRYIEDATAAHDVLFHLAGLDLSKMLAYNAIHKRKSSHSKKPL